jgi:hypothetical protein
MVQKCYDEQAQYNSIRYEESYISTISGSNTRSASFLPPIYSVDPRKEIGESFSHRWYLDDCHIFAEPSVGLINIVPRAYDRTIV